MMVDDIAEILSVKYPPYTIFRRNIPGNLTRQRKDYKSSICGIAVCGRAICGYTADNNAICGIAICGVAVCGRVSADSLPTITLMAEGGDSNQENLRQDIPNLNIFVRSTNANTCRDVLQAIEFYLLETVPKAINGTYYYSAIPNGSAYYVRKEIVGPMYLYVQSYDVRYAVKPSETRA